MHMTPDDVRVLATAADVLDRHGYDSSDLRACIAAAAQANEDEAVALGEEEEEQGDAETGIDGRPAAPAHEDRGNRR